MTPPKAPKGLGNSGRALWRSVVKAMPDGWELDERELVLLGVACRQRDDLAKLERAIKREGAMATGSKGQPVVHPAIPEARQARLAIGRLLGELSIPDETAERPLTAASRRARKAAQARWGHQREAAGYGA